MGVIIVLLVQAVALAGGEGECEHEWEWWASDTHHWQKCEKCNESKDEAPHNMSFDDTKNLYVCSVCGHECDHEHDFSGDWVKDGVDHWHVCKHKDCDAIDGYKRHTMVSDGEGYKCSECGYPRNHEKHQFDKYGFNGSGHWRKCSVKGCGVEDPDSYPIQPKPHTKNIFSSKMLKMAIVAAYVDLEQIIQSIAGASG